MKSMIPWEKRNWEWESALKVYCIMTFPFPTVWLQIPEEGMPPLHITSVKILPFLRLFSKSNRFGKNGSAISEKYSAFLRFSPPKWRILPSPSWLSLDLEQFPSFIFSSLGETRKPKRENGRDTEGFPSREKNYASRKMRKMIGGRKGSQRGSPELQRLRKSR